MDTKLTDFTKEELLYLGLAVKEKRKDAQSKINFLEGCMEDSEIRNDLYKSYSKDVEIFSQLETKIMEASIKLTMQEQINSN